MHLHTCSPCSLGICVRAHPFVCPAAGFRGSGRLWDVPGLGEAKLMPAAPCKVPDAPVMRMIEG